MEFPSFYNENDVRNMKMNFHIFIYLEIFRFLRFIYTNITYIHIVVCIF